MTTENSPNSVAEVTTNALPSEEEIKSFSPVQLLKAFQKFQESRVAIYKKWSRVFEGLMGGGTMGFFNLSTQKITENFAECSKQIILVEQALRDRSHTKGADLIRKVQVAEKKKMELTVKLQVLLKTHLLDKKGDELDPEFRESVQELRDSQTDVVETINDLLVEIQCEIGELMEAW